MTSLFEKLENETPEELKRRSLTSLDWFRNNVRDIRIRQDQALREDLFKRIPLWSNQKSI